MAELIYEKPIKNIIFDLGGVLIDLDMSKTINAFIALGINGLKEEDIHPYQKDFFLNIEIGTITPDEFLEKLRKEYPSASNVSDKAIWDAWNLLLLDFDMKRFELLDSLKSKYNLYLLSNTNYPHRIYYLEKFRNQSSGREFESYFSKCFYSDELKMRKPDAEIYRHVVEAEGLNPSETLFIDDNACNFEGAIEVGLNYHHLTGGEKIFSLFR